MLKTPDLSKLVTVFADSGLTKEQVELAVAECDNARLVVLAQLVFCINRKRLLDIIKPLFNADELQLMAQFMEPREFYVKQQILTAEKELLAVVILSLQGQSLADVSEYFYMKARKQLQTHAAETFKNSILIYLLYAWCNQVRFARHQMQVEAQQLSASQGPQMLIQLLCTTESSEFIEIEKNFELMMGCSIYEFYKKNGALGNDLFYFGYACAVLEGNAIGFVLKQRESLGSQFDGILRTVVLLFREKEYGRKEYHQALIDAMGELGELVCAISAIR